jgi:hypothetical protein
MTSRNDRESVKEKAMATAKEAQHDAAESLFGAIIAVLDNHEAERLPAAFRINRA